jgi:hypothetical protein
MASLSRADATRLFVNAGASVMMDRGYFVGTQHWSFSVWAHNAEYEVTVGEKDGKFRVFEAGKKGRTPLLVLFLHFHFVKIFR